MIKPSGFTLVELLVVLAIVGLLASLVGPVGFQQYERVRSIEEREQFYRLIDQVRFDAYQKQQPLRMSLDTNRIEIWRGREAEPIRELMFERLTFPEQIIEVNAHGFWQQSHVVWLEAEQERSQRLYTVAVAARADSAPNTSTLDWER